jgi:hypothetical protein
MSGLNLIYYQEFDNVTSSQRNCDKKNSKRNKEKELCRSQPIRRKLKA